MLCRRMLWLRVGFALGLASLAGCAAAVEDSGASQADLATARSPQQIAWAGTLRATIDTIDVNTGIAPSANVDPNELYARLEQELFSAPETPAALIDVLRKATLAYPSGHLSVTTNDGSCWAGGDVATASTSRVAACTQPYGDHAVVTYADTSSPLRAGDEILSVDGRRGDAMMTASLEQPMCTVGSASASNRRYVAATSLFALAKPGMQIEVKHEDGTIETKLVTTMSEPWWCRAVGDTEVVARASMRGDVGVIRVGKFALPLLEGETWEQMNDRVRAELVAAFTQVKHARAIVWDLRANSGGSTKLGLEIVAGFPGAREGAVVGSYRFRNPGTNTFGERSTYRLPARGVYAYEGKVAMIIDGFSMSAADYTARAAKLATDAILVGAPAAGAYGGGDQNVTVGELPSVAVQYDPWRGEDEDGSALEGKATEPTISVEFEPHDLAQNRDTVLHRAIEAVR